MNKGYNSGTHSTGLINIRHPFRRQNSHQHNKNIITHIPGMLRQREKKNLSQEPRAWSLLICGSQVSFGVPERRVRVSSNQLLARPPLCACLTRSSEPLRAPLPPSSTELFFLFGSLTTQTRLAPSMSFSKFLTRFSYFPFVHHFTVLLGIRIASPRFVDALTPLSHCTFSPLPPPWPAFLPPPPSLGLPSHSPTPSPQLVPR